MKNVYTYFCTNKLSINTPKTKYMVFSPHVRKKEIMNCKILNNLEVKRVSEFTFLGVMIDN